jgi:hypothetical protein
VHILATLTLVFTAVVTLRDYRSRAMRIAVAAACSCATAWAMCSSCSSTSSTAGVFVYAKFYLRTHKLFVGRVLHAGAVRGARHVHPDLRRQFADGVPRPGADGAFLYALVAMDRDNPRWPPRRR